MIQGEHAVVRTAEPDDTGVLIAVYAPDRIHAALLDPRRELTVPTFDELREALAQKDALRGILDVIEDRQGRVRGMCCLRGMNPEVAYAEAVLLCIDEADYATPLADEVLEYLMRDAFVRLKMNKIVLHALDSERALGEFVTRHGFRSDGVQREAVYHQGRWRDLESLSRFRADWNLAGQTVQDGTAGR